MASLALDILIAAAVVALLLYRQLRTRPVRTENGFKVVLVLGVIGVIEIASYTGKTSVNDTAWVLLAASLASAGVFGWLRGTQMHVWETAQGVMRRGNALTCALWLAGIGVHLLIDVGGGALASVPSGFGTSSLLLYLAATLGAQQWVLIERAQHMQTSAPLRPGG